MTRKSIKEKATIYDVASPARSPAITLKNTSTTEPRTKTSAVWNMMLCNFKLEKLKKYDGKENPVN